MEKRYKYFDKRTCNVCGHLLNIGMGRKDYFSRKLFFHWTYDEGWNEYWICAVCIKKPKYTESFVLSTGFYHPYWGWINQDKNKGELGTYWEMMPFGFIFVDENYKISEKEEDMNLFEKIIYKITKKKNIFGKLIDQIIDTNLHEFMHFSFDFINKNKFRKRKKEENVVYYVSYYIEQLLSTNLYDKQMPVTNWKINKSVDKIILTYNLNSRKK